MKDKLYQCVSCNYEEVVKASDHKVDGRSCSKCGAHSLFNGFIGVDKESKNK